MKQIFLAMLVTLFYYGCNSRDTGSETEVAIPVSVEDVKRKPIEEFISTTGSVYSSKEETIKSQISGYYNLQQNPNTGKPYALGDYVKKGQLIIKIEDAEFENGIQIESQKLNLEISKNEFDKQSSLYDKGGVTLRELKNAELTYINAKYSYDNALLQLAKMKIEAPFNGTIVELPYYTLGTKVDAQLVMATFMDYSNLYMEVNLPEKDLGNIKKGQTARITNYTLPDDTLQGKITQVSPAISTETRTFKASLNISNPKLKMRPGMFVRADIIIARRDSAIVIPKDIILSKQRGKTIYIVEKSAAQERVITTGLENPTEVEVLNGLKEGERYVTKGFETLSNRSKVKVIK